MKRIRKNDEVIVISGKHKGQKGSVLNIDWKNERVTINKINIVKKHVKPTQANPDGGIQEVEGTIHISNVALVEKGVDTGRARVGFKVEKNKKLRVSKKTGKEI